MADCCNIDCAGQSFNHRLRCSKCKKKKDYRCANCNVEVKQLHRIRCDDCIRFYKILNYKPIHRWNRKGCVKCQGETEHDRYHKYCTTCELSTHSLINRRNHNECQRCGVDIRNTRSFKWCKDCYPKWRVQYLAVKRNVVRYCVMCDVKLDKKHKLFCNDRDCINAYYRMFNQMRRQDPLIVEKNREYQRKYRLKNKE